MTMTGLLNARVVFGKTACSDQFDVKCKNISVGLVVCMTLLYMLGSRKQTSDHNRLLKL